MTKLQLKTIETPHGVGEIRKDGEHIASVTYHLQVRQEMVINESFSGENEEIPGQISITGEITINENEGMTPQVLSNMTTGEVLTLYLSDKRRLDIFATRGDPLSGQYQIAPYGSAGFISG